MRQITRWLAAGRRWLAAGLVFLAALSAATWITEAYVLRRAIKDSGVRWGVAAALGAAVAGFVALWGNWYAAKDRTPAGTKDEEPGPGRPVGQWDTSDLGVHRAIDPGENWQPDALPALPPYVLRGHDTELRNQIAQSSHSVMAVLVGGSSTGKTRACYQAIRAVPELSGWPVVYPADGAALGRLLSQRTATRTVLWLNETQLYLDGEHGPAIAARLRQLLTDDRQRVVVIGSMWPKPWQTFTTRPERGEQDKHAQVRELLELSRVCKIDVPDDFSNATADELAELQALAAEDPRLAAALQTGGPEMKITQVLAGGLMVVDRYEHTLDDHSKALITAAMDARRLGHREPLPAPLLEQAVPGYLTALQRAVDEAWFSTALKDATESTRGIRAVEPNRTGPGMGPPDSYVLHDYLDQYGRRVRRGTCPPASCWDALAAHTHGADDCNTISAAAELRSLYQYTVRLATAGAEAGSADCMCRLASRFHDAGHSEEAERWVRRAIDADSGWAVGRLVTWLRSAGREDEMEPIVRGAAERGHGQSTAELIMRLQDTGRDREAEAWIERLKQAAEGGDLEAIFWWTALLRWSRDRDYEISWSQGRHYESSWSRGQDYEGWLLRAAAAGIPEAIVTMSDDGTWRSDNSAVEPVLRQAADRGDPKALDMLHSLLARKGRGPEADQMWSRAAQKGSPYAMRISGIRLLEAGDHSDAKEWFHRAARAGDANAMCVWAGWLARVRDDDNAEHWLRRAAEADDPTAVALGTVWMSGGEGREDARRTLSAIAESGDSEVTLLTKNPSRPAAERWLREVAEAGSTHAAMDLSRWMQRDGRHAALEPWLRHLVEAAVANPNLVIMELSLLLHDSGRDQEAKRLRSFGIEPGGRTADPW